MADSIQPDPHQPQHIYTNKHPLAEHDDAPPVTPVRRSRESPRRSTRNHRNVSEIWTLPGTEWDQLDIERQKQAQGWQEEALTERDTPVVKTAPSHHRRFQDLNTQIKKTQKPTNSSTEPGRILTETQGCVPSAESSNDFSLDRAVSPSLNVHSARQKHSKGTKESCPSTHHSPDKSETKPTRKSLSPLVNLGGSRSAEDMARRPGRNQVDYMAELKESIQESLSKLSSIQEQLGPLGLQIVSLEEELKTKEGSSNVTLEDAKTLDELYRAKVKLTEQEISILHNPPDDLINKTGILNALTAREDHQAPARTSGSTKQRTSKRSTVDSDSAIVDSPGPTSTDPKASDQLRRVRGSGQRSSSVASQSTRDASSRMDDSSDSVRIGLAERAKMLVLHAEVAYKQSKSTHDSDGERIHCTINAIRKDKASGRPLYDIKDKDESEHLLYTAKFEDLLPIPPPGSQLPTFSAGKYVIALYPGTTTFYSAQVISLIAKRDVYSLKFEGEENEKEVKEVERRYVLDTKLK